MICVWCITWDCSLYRITKTSLHQVWTTSIQPVLHNLCKICISYTHGGYFLWDMLLLHPHTLHMDKYKCFLPSNWKTMKVKTQCPFLHNKVLLAWFLKSLKHQLFMAYFWYKKKTQPVTVLHVGIYSGFDFRMNRDLIFFKPRISDGSSTEAFKRNAGESWEG